MCHGLLEAVVLIPGEAAGYGGHRGHVAVGVMGVGVVGVILGVVEVVGGDAGGPQAIGAGVVVVAAGPAAAEAVRVGHAQDVADGVLLVALGVCVLGGGILGVGDGGEAVRGRDGQGGVLAAGRRDEAVGRIVRERLRGV